MDKTQTEAPKTPWVQRQLGGTAIAGVMGAGGGAIWGIAKKSPLPNGIKTGALMGVVASLGFGGMIYDTFFGPKKPASFVDLIEEQRAKDAQRAKDPQR